MPEYLVYQNKRIEICLCEYCGDYYPVAEMEKLSRCWGYCWEYICKDCNKETELCKKSKTIDSKKQSFIQATR